MYLYKVKMTDPYEDISDEEYFESEARMNSDELIELLLSAQKKLIKKYSYWNKVQYYTILKEEYGLFRKSLDCESSAAIRTRGY